MHPMMHQHRAHPLAPPTLPLSLSGRTGQEDLSLIQIHGDRYGPLFRRWDPFPEMVTVAIWGQRYVLRDKDPFPFVCSMNFLHSITVAVDQSRGNPPGEGHEPMSVTVCVNKP